MSERRKEYLENQKNERLGEEIFTDYGEIVTIIDYKKNDDILIEFNNSYKKRTSYRTFKNNKKLRNPYTKTVFNVGYIGEGDYKSKTKDDKITKQYNCWANMLKRCYYKKDENYKTYEDKYVCEEWHNFQKFAKWFDENYYETDGEIMDLDKDILFKGNKVYSPETCIFVPHRINTLFVKSNAIRGEYPIGVSLRSHDNKFKVNGTYNRNDDFVMFDTPEEAFDYYKKGKEKQIKQVADEYRDKIQQRLYEAMYRYKVEITD